MLKEINPEYSLERLVLKLQLQYDHLVRRSYSLEKTLMLGKPEGWRRRGGAEDEIFRWHHQLNGNKFEQTPKDSEGQQILVCYSTWDLKELVMT